MVPVFDGHNDVLLRLWMKKQGDPVADFLNGETGGHLDLPRMIKGGFQGGFFAIFAPSPEDADALISGALETPRVAPVRASNEIL